ncbi:MAG: methyltransferase [Devosia sp.]|nr:methyltransferase [Devosia sp.]
MSLDQPRADVKPVVNHLAPTIDAFLGGALTVSQPAKGYRAGLDAVLLGAAVAPGSRSVLDLGCGVGTAGLVALSQRSDRTALLAERDPDLVALAVANLAANGFANRARVALVDVTARGVERKAAGLLPDAFDTVIANPPFFSAGQGTLATDPGRAGARHMPADALDLWVKAAATSVCNGGETIFVLPATLLGVVLASFAVRFGAITALPLVPRPDAPASRVLVRGVKGSRAPLTLLASRALHGAAGHDFAPEFEAILRGTGRLDW